MDYKSDTTRLGQVLQVTRRANSLADELSKLGSTLGHEPITNGDEEIFRANADLRSSLVDVARYRNAVLSPISRLNLDIIQTIFVLASGVSSSGASQAARARVRSALLISRVCHQWRTIALDLATLWTDILFSPVPFGASLKPPWKSSGAASSVQRNAYDARNREFLIRSKAALLNVVFEGAHQPHPLSASLVGEFARTIPDRVLSLEASVPNVQDAVQLLGSMPDDMSALKVLHVSVRHMVGIRSMLAPESAPTALAWKEFGRLLNQRKFLLDDLLLNNVRLAELFPEASLSLQTLRTLNLFIMEWTPTSLLALFQACPRLRYLKIVQTPSRPWVGPSQTPPQPSKDLSIVDMADMVEVDLSGPNDFLEQILSCVRAGSLDTLRITYSPNQPSHERLVQTIETFLRLSQCPLKSLSFCGVERESYLDILSTVPGLESVTWKWAPHSPGQSESLSLFKWLSPANPGEGPVTLLCPLIKTLAFDFPLTSRRTPDVLNSGLRACLHMIAARRTCAMNNAMSCIRLRHLQLSVPPFENESAEEVLGEMALQLDDLIVNGWKLDRTTMEWSRDKTTVPSEIHANAVINHCSLRRTVSRTAPASVLQIQS